MTDFIIAGTSGVGKTYLEEVLADKYDFYPLVKYMDREPRPGELDNPRVGFISTKEFLKLKDSGGFAFTLEYSGNNYGWKKSDIQSHFDQNKTIAITLDSLGDVFENLKGWIPVMLHIDKDSIDLIEERIKVRSDYKNLDKAQKEEVRKKIDKRVKMAKDELTKFGSYRDIIRKHNGKIFTIKDDKTLFDEVIPYILKKANIND
jgi:guanylate kinase